MNTEVGSLQKEMDANYLKLISQHLYAFTERNLCKNRRVRDQESKLESPLIYSALLDSTL